MSKVLYELVCACSGMEVDDNFEIFFDKLVQARFQADFPTIEEAQAFVAQFPKSVKIKACYVSSYSTGSHVQWGRAYFGISLSADQVNGGKNEAGIKRIKSFVKSCAKHGHSMEPKPPFALNEVQAIRDLESYGFK